MTASDTPAAPRQTLSTWDGVAFIVGVVVGIGIFRLPSLVASGVSSEAMFIGVWLLGGVVMLVGALCYAELGSAHPDAGGEYHFLTRAFGWRVGVLFAWARGTVIQTGAIAAVAFVYADYASNIVPLGTYSAAIHAVIGVVAVTAVNLTGTAQGVRAQLTLTTLTILALLAVIVAGFSTAGVPHPPVNPASQWGSIGLAMVFVMFAYGGWNEAAYLSGELKDVKRNMVRTLLLGTAVVVALYALANLAYLNVFGLEGLRKSSTVGASLMGVAVGSWGAIVFSIIVCICALSTLNATIFTGARAYYALGRDVPAIRKLGVWDEQGRQAGERASAPGGNRAGAPRLRFHHARRARGHDLLYGPGVLFVHAADRALAVHLPQSRHRPALPDATLSPAADPVRRRLGLDDLFHDRVCRRRLDRRHRGAAPGHAAAASEAHRSSLTRAAADPPEEVSGAIRRRLPPVHRG